MAVKMGKMVDVPTFKLNDSTSIPALARGTADFNDRTEWAVIKALEIGYRHIDTALAYKTEQAIGNALQKAFATGLVKRQDVYVTTKIPSECLHIDEILNTMKKSLSDLRLDYVDCYLIHWPMRLKKGTTFTESTLEDRLPLDIKATWEEMEKLVALGLTKSIGVSNFCVKKLQELLLHAKIVPAINQIELHPHWQQDKLRAFCTKNGIRVGAWSPLGAPGTVYSGLNVVDNPILKQIALKHKKSVPQIALRWIYESGVIPVPKSYNEQRLTENISIWDFVLTDEDHVQIKTIEQISLSTSVELTSAIFKGFPWSTSPEFADNEE